MRARIVTIGDEILIGQIIDTNSAWMAQQLNLQGIEIEAIFSVSDTHEAITRAIDDAFAAVDVILVTGGLGPTKDDITKQAIADYFGVGMVFSDETYERILRMFERWGRKSTEAHRLQCYMPENATLLKNKMGTAPGMWFNKGNKVMISMPGVPYEMKYLMTEEVLPALKANYPSQPIAHRTVLTAGEGESRINARISDFELGLPSELKLAFLPSLGKVRLRLTARGADEQQLNQLLTQKVEELKELLPDLIFGYGEDTLEAAIGRLLVAQKKTLSTAESCTGGYLAHRITSIAGASAYFKGSIIAYDNQVKIDQLAVPATILETEGAVSEKTVIAMVRGAVTRLGTDIAVATSGIAGPTGGTEEKPVGTIWIAVGNQTEYQTLKLQLGKDRLKNIEYTANSALNMIRKFLIAK
ncbi:MAG: competence/damage-inducible protein A [Saprospiraceae bacterium]